MPLDPLHYRILEISHKHKLSHIGSSISCVDIIDEIYGCYRQPHEAFCLGNAHAGLALYVVLEKYLGIDAEYILEKDGIHATYCKTLGVHVSGGSLGQVETVAMGLALSKRADNVYLLSSDGGAAEGAFWETLAFKSENNVKNLRWYVNANGFAAYKSVNVDQLEKQIHSFCHDVQVRRTGFHGIPFLNGLNAHYYVMNENDWKWVEANK